MIRGGKLWLDNVAIGYQDDSRRYVVPKEQASAAILARILTEGDPNNCIELAFEPDSVVVEPYIDGTVRRYFTSIILVVWDKKVFQVGFEVVMRGVGARWTEPAWAPVEWIHKSYDVWLAARVSLLVRGEPGFDVAWGRSDYERNGRELIVAICGPFARIDNQLRLCSVVRTSSIDNEFALVDGRWVEQLSPIGRFRWPFVSRFICELMLGLGGVLPPYVVLEIFDWLDESKVHTQLTKIRYIEGVHHSIRHVCSKR